MSTGKIWPEYWIDCAVCEFMEPLAMTTKTQAVAEAHSRGWRCSIVHKWVCKDCQEKQAKAA